MNFATCSYTDAGVYNKIWWKAHLGQSHCIYQIVEYQSSGHHQRVFICTVTGCVCTINSCNGVVSATVGFEVLTTELPPSTSDCKNGDYVKLEGTGAFLLYEVAITTKPGKTSNSSFLCEF